MPHTHPLEDDENNINTAFCLCEKSSCCSVVRTNLSRSLFNIPFPPSTLPRPLHFSLQRNATIVFGRKRQRSHRVSPENEPHPTIRTIAVDENHYCILHRRTSSYPRPLSPRFSTILFFFLPLSKHFLLLTTAALIFTTKPAVSDSFVVDNFTSIYPWRLQSDTIAIGWTFLIEKRGSAFVGYVFRIVSGLSFRSRPVLESA